MDRTQLPGPDQLSVNRRCDWDRLPAERQSDRRRKMWDGQPFGGAKIALLADGALFDEVRFGDEGQKWNVVEVADFLQMTKAVASMEARLKDYCDRAGT